MALATEVRVVSDSEPNQLFVALIAGLQMSAWAQLGKVMNPATGKVERDLDHARETIDLLAMLQEKTRGNLHAQEDTMLTRILLDLRLNFVEEQKTGAVAPPSSEN